MTHKFKILELALNPALSVAIYKAPRRVATNVLALIMNWGLGLSDPYPKASSHCIETVEPAMVSRALLPRSFALTDLQEKATCW